MMRKMKTKEFDYYIYIDYSENLIGYNIIEKENIKDLLLKISKFRHYRDAKNRKLYLKYIKNTIDKEKILSYFIKTKIRDCYRNLEIYSDVAEFLKNNNNCLVLISVDDNQYKNFLKLVKNFRW